MVRGNRVARQHAFGALPALPESIGVGLQPIVVASVGLVPEAHHGVVFGAVPELLRPGRSPRGAVQNKPSVWKHLLAPGRAMAREELAIATQSVRVEWQDLSAEVHA